MRTLINKFTGLFNFNIVIGEKQKQRRTAVLTLSAIILLSVFIYGYITVYKNSYNIMNTEPMVVFQVNSTEDGISFVILNNRINLY